MKTFTVLAVLACALSCEAITISVIEDSATRFRFAVDWSQPGDGSGSGVSFTESTSTAARNIIDVTANNIFAPDTFQIEIGADSRNWSRTLGFSGTEFHINANLHRGEFTYGEPLPAGVPDGGATVALLGFAVAAMGVIRRHR